ncbi:MAG: FAD-dependent oxidoreductase [Chloroflexi bacterium]|nr:FAD-dependent oxidoreductase [Chloroflexota bacterium]
MQKINEPARQIDVLRQVDVLVVGGGPAGLVAATAAARQGARTLLVERYGCLGGLATGGLVLYMDAITDKAHERVIGGLPWEVLQRLDARGGLVEDAPLRLHVDSELLQAVADDICLESGVELLFHAWGVAALVEKGRVIGVVIESKSGRQAILASVTVDATGDGDIAAFAGARYELGSQCIGLNLKVGGADRARYQQFQREQPERARELREEIKRRGGFPLGLGSTPHSDIGVYWVNILGLSAWGRPGGGEGDVHAYFAGELSAIDVQHLTHVQIELRRRILLSLDFYRQHVPGFENVRLLAFASQIGTRESRRIAGVHLLTKEEVQAGMTFPDAIGRAGITYDPIGSYQVPYGSLVPEAIDGLLVAGRCISVDHWTLQGARLIPPAMMTGQAAGTAAAMAVASGVAPRHVDTAALQRQLVADGVIL